MNELDEGYKDVIRLFVEHASTLGWSIIKAIAVFIIGRILIGIVHRLIKRFLEKRHVEPTIRTFVSSLTNVVLVILLIIAVIGTLGVQTTSFAALLASAGVAIGMALSGNLANFAGGLIILLFKPFKVEDFVECQDVKGFVKEIQIFHTLLVTPDNKKVYIPNGALSSGTVINYSQEETRRVDWIFGVEYGENYAHVKEVIESILAKDERILKDPEQFIALHALADSSVNIVVRVWVKSPDYWPVYFDINEQIYRTFNETGIGFPFPQLTVHQAKE